MAPVRFVRHHHSGWRAGPSSNSPASHPCARSMLLLRSMRVPRSTCKADHQALGRRAEHRPRVPNPPTPTHTRLPADFDLPGALQAMSDAVGSCHRRSPWRQNSRTRRLMHASLEALILVDRLRRPRGWRSEPLPLAPSALRPQCRRCAEGVTQHRYRCGAVGYKHARNERDKCL